MANTKYPRVFTNLLQVSDAYRSGSAHLADLKAAVWNAVQSIVAVDELETRTILQRLEGELDMIEFTVDENKVFESSLAIVGELEKLARSFL